MIREYEQRLLIAGEVMYQDLVKSGTDQAVLEAIKNDLQARRIRIAQLEGSEVEAAPYIFLPFTDEDKKKLRGDGASIYLLEGQSIGSQGEGGRMFGSSWHKGQAIEYLTSRIYEVAIYSNDFFVPGTFNTSKAKQEELVTADGQVLQARLNIEHLEEILPEAPEVTEVMFKHFDATNVCLLGKAYMTEHRYWSYIRTNTSTNKSGSSVAGVGAFGADRGPGVLSWDACSGSPNLAAARWVVKIVN